MSPVPKLKLSSLVKLNEPGSTQVPEKEDPHKTLANILMMAKAQKEKDQINAQNTGKHLSAKGSAKQEKAKD